MDDALPHGSKAKPTKRRAKKQRPIHENKAAAARRAKWKAEKQTRGSEMPIEGRCGCTLSRTDPPRYCTRWPSKGRETCASHSGTKRRGAESPSFVHGQRSELYADVLGGALARGYEAIQTDEELLSCREQIKLWTGRERALVEQLSSGGGMSEQAIRETMAAVDEVARMPAKTDGEKQLRAETVGQRMEELRRAVHRLSDDKEAWRDLEVAGRMLVRFRGQERRLVEAKHVVLSVEKVLYLMALLTAVAMKYVVDPIQRARFCEDAKLLSDGHSVEIDAELLDAVPFGRGLT